MNIRKPTIYFVKVFEKIPEANYFRQIQLNQRAFTSKKDLLIWLYNVYALYAPDQNNHCENHLFVAEIEKTELWKSQSKIRIRKKTPS